MGFSSHYRNTHNEEIVAFSVLYGRPIIPAEAALGFHTESLLVAKEIALPKSPAGLGKKESGCCHRLNFHHQIPPFKSITSSTCSPVT